MVGWEAICMGVRGKKNCHEYSRKSRCGPKNPWEMAMDDPGVSSGT